MNNREQLLSKVCSDDHRLQYDGNDGTRMTMLATAFTDASVAMIEALGAFNNAAEAPVSDTSADEMKAARYDAVSAWTMAQAAVSKVAFVLRIDGEEAYRRAIKAVENEEDPEFSGL